MSMLDLICSGVTEIPTIECNALVELYTSTNGNGWIANDSWLSDNSPCRWYGVDCNNFGRVGRLFLNENGLFGSLPSKIADLQELTVLQLNGNQIGGELPPTLGTLDSLIWLRLEDNAFLGTIPSEFGSFDNLENLYLSQNMLSGELPTELGKLTNLRRLYTSSNQLRGKVPIEFGSMEQLRSLTLGDNQFDNEPFPNTLVNLDMMTYLHFIGSGVCTPTDASFVAWLATVDGVYGPSCMTNPTAGPQATPEPQATPLTYTPTTPPPSTISQPQAPMPPKSPTEGYVNLCKGLTTDRNTRPMQPLAKPDYLQTVLDPAFGTTIRRITDVQGQQGVTDGSMAVLKPMYNTIQAWNTDETYLILYQRARGHMLLDGITYAFIRYLDIFPADLEEVFWDYSDPDILYYVEPYYRSAEEPGQRLVQYSVSNDSKTGLRSFRDVCGEAGIESGNDVQAMSWDSDTIGLRCVGNPGLFFGYTISTDTITPVITSGVGNAFSPWVAPQPTSSGNFYVLDSTVLDTNMNFVRTLNQASPEHSNLGRFRNGRDGMFTVAFAEGPAGGCGPGALIAHDILDGTCTTLVGRENGYPYPPSGIHHSALAHHNPGWVAVSIIGVANWGQTENTGQELLDNELLLVDSAFGGDVCRIGHHRSWARGGSAGYFGEPHVVISPSGTRILYGSDWEGSGSVDSYVVELPTYDRPDESNPPLTFGCFSGRVEVEVQHKGVLTMRNLALGDKIKVDANKYEPIYSFGHKSDLSYAEFVQIFSEGSNWKQKPLEVSSNHILFLESGRAIPASMVKVGDSLRVAQEEDIVVTKIIRNVIRRGVYAPFTRSGTVVVNGIVASNYIAYQPSEFLSIAGFPSPFTFHWLAHTFLSVQRLVVEQRGIRAGDTYSDTGISNWVEIPHRAGSWLLKQNALVIIVVLIPTIFILGFLSLLEIVICCPFALASGMIGAIILFRVKCTHSIKDIE